MSNCLTSRFRHLLLSFGLLALMVALPFAAQQLPPFDEARIVADMNRELQLTPEQAAKLRELIAAHRRAQKYGTDDRRVGGAHA